MELKDKTLQHYYYEKQTYGKKYDNKLTKMMMQSLETTPFCVKIADLGFAR